MAPRKDAPRLLVERAGRLEHIDSSGRLIHDFGDVGPVDCPLAYDPASNVAFRYVCEGHAVRRDFSVLCAFDLSRGNRFPLLRLGVNQWILWMLDWLQTGPGQPGALFGLIATDERVDSGISIRHNLFAFHPGRANLQLRPICRDAYQPLALNLPRREILFAGAEGCSITGLKGERRAALASPDVAFGRGGSLRPGGAPEAAIGGGGLFLWQFGTGTCRKLTRKGQFPVFSPDGRGIWYSESSSDLFFYDFERDRPERILSLSETSGRERSFARPPALSRCGRFLGVPLTARRLSGARKGTHAAMQTERVYRYTHAFAILDVERCEFWFLNGLLPSFRWL